MSTYYYTLEKRITKNNKQLSMKITTFYIENIFKYNKIND